MILAAGAGCQSTIEDIESNYRRVFYHDGVNQKEAVAIAQMRLKKTPFTNSFNVDKPRLIKNEFSSKYPNFWFITFPSQDVMSEVEYLIVLERYTGGVIRSTEYNPDVQYNFEWLFN
jgi:hypothetical protein